MDLAELKSEYEKLAKKHKLPSFKELNENFEIDKIEKESEFLLRVIRKVMMEKITNAMSFLELLINPVNTPRLYMAYVRGMTQGDRNEIEKIYTAFGELSINSLDLEIDYSETKEAEIVNSIFRVWNSVKPSFRIVLGSMKKPANAILKKEKTYFG